MATSSPSLRTGRVLAGALGALLLMSACGGSAAPTSPATPGASSDAAAKPAASSNVNGAIKFRIGMSQASTQMLPYFVALDKKLFAKSGLDASINLVDPYTMESMLVGSALDVINISGAQLMADDVAGAMPMTMISANAKTPLQSIFVEPNIKTPQDLAKKTLAIIRPNTSSESAARLLLGKLKMTLDDVNVIYGQSSDGTRDLLLNGKVQAAVMSPPQTIQAKAKGFVEFANGPSLGVPLVATGPGVARDYLAAHPDVVKRFLQGYVDGWKFLADPANEQTAATSLSKWTKASMEESVESYRYYLPVWQKGSPMLTNEAIATQQSLEKDAKLREADPSKFFDNKIVESIFK